MMERERQLRERDVRKDAPEIDPTTFLSMYLESNFPQTATHPSKDQAERGIIPKDELDDVRYNKKPLSGTSFDNPARS
jgi:hypothetical protein